MTNPQHTHTLTFFMQECSMEAKKKGAVKIGILKTSEFLILCKPDWNTLHRKPHICKLQLNYSIWICECWKKKGLLSRPGCVPISVFPRWAPESPRPWTVSYCRSRNMLESETQIKLKEVYSEQTNTDVWFPQ